MGITGNEASKPTAAAADGDRGAASAGAGDELPALRERLARVELQLEEERASKLGRASKHISYQPDEVLTDKSGCCAVLPALCAAAFPSVSTS
jgi:hypothetical protein